MANNYFTRFTSFVAGTSADAEDVEGEAANILAGFDKLPKVVANLTNDAISFVTESGAADAYAVTFDPVRTAYRNGDKVCFIATNTNTGASTLKFDSLATKSLVGSYGTALAANAIVSGNIVEARYDSANNRFLVISPTDTASAASFAAAAAASALAAANSEASFGLDDALSNDNASQGTDLVMTSGDKITTNTINETTAASGVTIDGVLLKDSGITATGTAATGALTVTGAATVSGDVAISGTQLSGSMLTINRGNSSEAVIALTDESSSYHHGLILKGNDTLVFGRSSSNASAGMEPFLTATLSTLGAQFAGALGVSGNITSTAGTVAATNAGAAVNVIVCTATNASFTGGALQVITTRAAHATAFDLAKFSTSAGGTTNCRIRGDGDLENTNNAYGGISDRKLKQDITESSDQLEDVLLLAAVIKKFRMIEQVKNDPDAHAHLGFIAQEIQAISPGLITESPDKVRALVEKLDDDGVVVTQDVTEKRKRQRVISKPLMEDWDEPVPAVIDDDGQVLLKATTKISRRQVTKLEKVTVAEHVDDNGVLHPESEVDQLVGQTFEQEITNPDGSPVTEEYDFVTGQEPVMEWGEVLNGETTLSVKYSIAYMKLFKAFGEYVEKTDARLKALEG